jgi:hypothetical protein
VLLFVNIWYLIIRLGRDTEVTQSR